VHAGLCVVKYVYFKNALKIKSNTMKELTDVIPMLIVYVHKCFLKNVFK
jgi:hypothetical protein